MCYKHRREDWKKRRARKVHTIPVNEYIPAKTSSQIDRAHLPDETSGPNNNSTLKVGPSETVSDPTSHLEDKSPAIPGEKSQKSHPIEYAAVLTSAATEPVGYVPSTQANVPLTLQYPNSSTNPSPIVLPSIDDPCPPN